jgi:hypothetical protein
MKTVTRLQRISPLTRFLLSGSVLEILYLLIFKLIPLNSTHSIHSSSSTDWSWIFGPAQPPVFTTSILSLTFTDLVSHFLLLSLIIIALSSVYLYAVGSAFHSSNNITITSRWLFILLIGATIFGITLLFLSTLFNIGANSYIFKGLALIAHLINCVLIWAILSQLAPARRLGGTILYAWNPLALTELAGNGHNDGLLIFFLLLTGLLIIKQKGRWYDLWAMVFLGCAMSMNFVALLFAPMIICFCVLHKTKQSSSGVPQPDGEHSTTTIPLSPDCWKRNYVQLLWGLAWRAIVSLTTMSALYFLFWHRSLTYLSIFSSFDTQYFTHSPLSILVIPVRWLNSFFFQTLHLSTGFSSDYLQAIPAANMAVQAFAMFIFALMYIYLLGKVRSIDTLLTCMCLAILGFLILLSAQFWPWYILWTLWISALRRFDELTISVLLLSCTALLTYPLLYVDNVPIAIYQPLLIFGIPLIYLITRLKRSDERMTTFYERRSKTAKN